MSYITIIHNEQYACFSTITDTLITPFLSGCEYDGWRTRKPHERHTEGETQTLQEALSMTRLNATHEDTLNRYAQCGISLSELEHLLQAIEDANYTPRERGDGQYECPNCGEPVVEGQTQCSNDACTLRFFRAAGSAQTKQHEETERDTTMTWNIHEIINWQHNDYKDELVQSHTITGDTVEVCFKRMYALRRSGRYDRVRRYAFEDPQLEAAYQKWKQGYETIETFYGGGVVD